MSVTLVSVLDETCRQIEETFKKNLPKLAAKISFGSAPGVFNEQEIRRLAQRVPAIKTALVKYEGNTNTDNSMAHFVTWILYSASNSDVNGKGALALVSAIIPIIRRLDAEWCYDTPQNITADCLYTGSLDKINATLWAVSWDWHLRGIEEPEGQFSDISELDIFAGADGDTLVDKQTVYTIGDINKEEKDGDSI